MKSIKHPNVVELKEIATCASEKEGERDDVYLVFEYCDTDLSGLMDLSREKLIPWFDEETIKCYSYQLLVGLKFLHEMKIMHRDLKCSNILINKNNELKLADFGLSRSLSSMDRDYTNKVITLWYRPPELLLGSSRYNSNVDMWSVGCIIGELLVGKAIFNKTTENDQLEMILDICGSEGLETIETEKKNLLLKNMKLNKERKLREHLESIGKEKQGEDFKLSEIGFDLINKLLVIDGNERLSAKECLEHEWFNKVLKSNELDELKIPTSGAHELETKQYRRKKNEINKMNINKNIENNNNK